MSVENKPSFDFSGTDFTGARFYLERTPAQILTQFFDELLPLFAARLAQRREELHRFKYLPTKTNADIFLDTVRAEIERLRAKED